MDAPETNETTESPDTYQQIHQSYLKQKPKSDETTESGEAKETDTESGEAKAKETTTDEPQTKQETNTEGNQQSETTVTPIPIPTLAQGTGQMQQTELSSEINDEYLTPDQWPLQNFQPIKLAETQLKPVEIQVPSNIIAKPPMTFKNTFKMSDFNLSEYPLISWQSNDEFTGNYVKKL